ncbi:site-specific integrase [Agromyces sp. NPDC055661]
MPKEPRAGTHNYPKTRSDWGSVRKLPSGRWQASYVHDEHGTGTATRFPAPMTFTTKTDARAWLTGVRVDIERGKWRNPNRAAAERFGTYATTWISQRVSKKGRPLAPKTRAEYERYLRVGLAPFADTMITKVTSAEVRRWHAERLDHGATQAGNEARLLRAILNTAVEDQIIERNPVAAQLTRTQTGQEHRQPTLDELTVIVDVIDPFYRLAVLIAAYGGLRLSEWRALRRRDIAIEGDRVRVNVERQAQRITGYGWVVGKPKSKEGVRVAFLPSGLTPQVREHLENYVDRFPDSLVFPPPGTAEFLDNSRFNKAWDAARDTAGVRGLVRGHDLRGFAGTMHQQQGASIRETMAFLGHSTTVAAMAYQATTGRDAELADRMILPTARPSRLARIGGAD